jgi:DNA-binding LacI/PurR family transcriptional regulator
MKLADELEQSIRGSGLKPGDAYPGTSQVAQQLGVSTHAANSALRILVKRGILHRRRRSGTVIAQLSDTVSRPALERIHLLVEQDSLRLEGLLGDGLLIGLQGEFPRTGIQFSFLPSYDGTEYAKRLIDRSLCSKVPEGFVLVRAPLPVQRLVQSSDLPAVVFGSLQPSVKNTPWIDRDQRQIADLLLECLLSRGCRRVVVLLRSQMAPGDVVALDRVLAVLGSRGFSAAEVAVRCLPPDSEAVKCATIDLLANGPRPVGFFCRNALLADGVAAAAESADLRLGTDVMITIADVYRKSGGPTPVYPYIRSALTAEDIGRHIGRMLAQQARGERPDPDHEVLPVILEEPNQV